MANGDRAAAAGLEVFSGTQDRRQGYDNDNIRGDEIADLMNRLGQVTDIKLQQADPGHKEGRLWISWV